MSADPCDAGRNGAPLMPLVEALRLMLERAIPLEVAHESIALADAGGRVLAQDLLLDRDEPPVPRSAMDGFALRSVDGEGPRELLATVYAGTAEIPEVGPGQASAVMTGGTVPPGADAVIPVELTRVEGEVLHVERASEAGQHVRAAGEMGQAGRVLAPAGTRISTGLQAVAASSGVDPIAVRRSPKAIVLSTGDEVVPWTETPAVHQVRDSNRLATALQLQEMGATIVRTAAAPDEEGALLETVQAALADADVLVTIGGVSMGEKDLLPGVFAAAGVEKLVHKVSVQPGKPVWIGSRGSQWVVGLPGNPVSSFVMTELVLRPLLNRLSGCTAAVEAPRFACELTGAARSRGRERYLPARRVGAGAELPRVEPLLGHGSGDWTVLAQADCLLHLPAQSSLQAGDRAHYLPLRLPDAHAGVQASDS